ncbi:hypothetical protein AURDEDRAFT_93889 [Auricularia subglabra TFB-10046 SS5]|nr:hypothetical protein AURDEDRAFT_93889 [Auricularia subglabra TFB-10046 SS5]
MEAETDVSNNLVYAAIEIVGEPEEPVAAPVTLPAQQKRARKIATEEPPARAPRNILAREIRENLAKFSHCILLTRVGSFYESYFEQAAEVAQLLGIKLTSRSWEGTRVLMCGFPLPHLDKYLKVLVQQNRRFVALCEEFRVPSATGNVLDKAFERRVTRVLTPGTLIDESFLNHYQNNYLLAVSDAAAGKKLGLAWMDVSTGEFFAQDSTMETLRDDVARIGPQEVVIDRTIQATPSHPLPQLLTEEGCFVSYIAPGDAALPVASGDTMDDLTATQRPKPVFSAPETAAIALLTTYLHANLMEHMPRALVPAAAGGARMQIDAHTIKALEIRESMREGGVTGSLLSVVKRTTTSSGTRLLARWLCSPSTSIAEINARQGLVALFLRLEPLRRDVLEMLRRVEDASRIVQRFLLGRGDADDLAAIRDTIALWARIKARIELERALDTQAHPADNWADIDMLLGKMKDLGDLVRRIDLAVYDRTGARTIGSAVDDAEEGEDDEVEAGAEEDVTASPALLTGTFKHTIKPGYSPELAGLHEQLQDLHAAREALQARLQRRYEAPSLTLRFNPGWGFHVHIAKAKRDLVKIDTSSLFVPIAQSGSTKAFFNKEWFQTGNAIAATVIAIQTAEREAFESLRNEVNAEATPLRRNARIMDEIDVTLSFATLAREMNLVRPVVTDSKIFHIVNGRHPTVELGLLASGRQFTPNSVHLSPESRLHVITGPNMAGKSTLLRQTALIAVLAQVGAYVPADSAEVGVVDKVFSRVGAKDDLFRDRSTFMVEMLETAEILKKATDRSLVIMDEVGRGTTVRDGLAIAFAALQHLYSVNGCRALFATHFHEVADMLGYVEPGSPADTVASPQDNVFKHVGFFCTDVDEMEDGHFAYSHRLRPGVNRDSHGLKVAALARMPKNALGVARGALDWLRTHRGQWAGNSAELQQLGRRLSRTEKSSPDGSR